MLLSHLSKQAFCVPHLKPTWGCFVSKIPQIIYSTTVDASRQTEFKAAKSKPRPRRLVQISELGLPVIIGFKPSAVIILCELTMLVICIIAVKFCE